MGSDFRTVEEGRLFKIEELERSVAQFLAANPDGTCTATELSQQEAGFVGNYFVDKGYSISHRKVVKTRSGVVDYRVDIKNRGES